MGGTEDPGAGPLVVAHRGSSHAVAEHTLGAYLRAIEEGADALECDVRLTRDGHLVCVHDRRVDRTSNGTGTLSDFDLDDLHGLDFASWKANHHRLPDEYIEERSLSTTPEPVLTLDRLVQAVQAAPRPVRMLIETKHPTRYAGLVELQLIRLLRRYGLADPPDQESSQVTVMSFSGIALRRVRLLAPMLPTVLLMDRFGLGRRDGSLPNGVSTAGPGVHLLRNRPGYADRARAKGHRVYVWTVDEPDDVDMLLDLGVDAIITNRPDMVLEHLGR